MANVRKSFGGTSKSGTEDIDLKAYVNDNNELFVSIKADEHDFGFICLDYDTAVVFLDEVRKCVNEMNRYSE